MTPLATSLVIKVSDLDIASDCVWCGKRDAEILIDDDTPFCLDCAAHLLESAADQLDDAEAL